MLRNKQHVKPALLPAGLSMDSLDDTARIEVLADLLDTLDLHSFLLDPAYRRRLNSVLSSFSDEEFDSFERLYTRRFTVN